MAAIRWGRVVSDGFVWLIASLFAAWILHRLHVLALRAVTILRKSESDEGKGPLLSKSNRSTVMDEEAGLYASPAPLLQMPWNFFTAWGGYFPLSGMLACLAISLMHDYRSVTETHCAPRFDNFMPSISACIGDYAPQRFIWGVSIALGVPMRTVSGWVFRAHYMGVKELTSLNNLRFSLYCGEQFGLVLLTVVTSSHSLTVHQVGFGLFSVCSVLSMITTCWLLTKKRQLDEIEGQKYLSTFLAWNDPRRRRDYTPVQTAEQGMAEIARKIRLKLLAFNMCSITMAIYWYFAHDAHCAHYYYSYFAICEWSFVLSNVAFHMVELLDLSEFDLSLGKVESLQFQSSLVQ